MKQPYLFYNWDYLSKKPCLYFFGYNKYYTKTGIIISLIALLLSIGFTIYFLYDFFHFFPINIIYLTNNESSGNYNLSDTLFMINQIGDFSNKDITISAYLQIENEASFTKSSLKLVNCADILNHLKSISLYSSLDLNTIYNSYCLFPNQSSIIIKNDNINKINQRLVIEVRLCDKSKDILCNDINKIVETISNVSLGLQFLVENNDINHFQKKNPINSSISNIYVYPLLNYHYQKELSWKNITYEYDNGYLFSNKKSNNFINIQEQFYSNRMEREITDVSVPLATITFGLFPKSDKIIRSYRRLQNVLSDIWCFILFIEFIGKLIISIITSKSYYSVLTRNIINDNKIFKNNIRIGKNLFEEEKKEIKVTNCSLTPVTEPTNVHLLTIEKNNPHLINQITFGKKGFPQLKTSKDIIEDINNYYKKIKMCEYIFPQWICRKTKGQEIMKISESFIRNYLSCEDLIKNKIHLYKLIELYEDKAGLNICQIKPSIVLEIEQNKILNEKD